MKPFLNQSSKNMTRLVRVIMAIFWLCVIFIAAYVIAWLSVYVWRW